MASVVCFHNLRRCGFCGVPGRAAPRARPRCNACGRFVPHDHPDDHSCGPCRRRGFRALRLFRVA